MKVCVGNGKKGKITFPSLVEGFDGLIVLAVEGGNEEFSGVVLVKGETAYDVGEVNNSWDTTTFAPFDSSITISNK